MAIRAKALCAAAFSVPLLGACASQTGSITPPPAALSPAGSPAAETVTRLPSGGSYRMTQDELGLDCKKLTGRMAVRIVQIRDYQSRSQASFLARSLQTAWKPANGGKGAGSDPDGRYARDRAMLVAYNQRLAEKNCANFDLDAELAPDAKDPPRTRPLRKS